MKDKKPMNKQGQFTINPLNKAYFNKMEDLGTYAEIDDNESEDDPFMTRSQMSIQHLAESNPQ